MGLNPILPGFLKILTIFRRRAFMIAVPTYSNEFRWGKTILWMVSIEIDPDATRCPSPTFCLRGHGRFHKHRPRPAN
jgi:hypothetical protein